MLSAESWITVAIAILGSSVLGSAVSALFARRLTKAQSSREEADAASVITDAAEKAVKIVSATYEGRIKSLELTVANLTKENARLKVAIDALQHRIEVRERYIAYLLEEIGKAGIPIPLTTLQMFEDNFKS